MRAGILGSIPSIHALLSPYDVDNRPGNAKQAARLSALKMRTEAEGLAMVPDQVRWLPREGHYPRKEVQSTLALLGLFGHY